MGRSQETLNKKEVRQKKEKKRKDKEKRRLASKETDKNTFDDMIAYVDAFGNITNTPPDPDAHEDVELEDIEISVSKSDPNEKPDTQRKGIVAFFNDSKGYGFIRDLETGQRYFVHINNIEEPIKEDNLVVFETAKGPKGPTAMQVKLSK